PSHFARRGLPVPGERLTHVPESAFGIARLLADGVDVEEHPRLWWRRLPQLRMPAEPLGEPEVADRFDCPAALVGDSRRFEFAEERSPPLRLAVVVHALAAPVCHSPTTDARSEEHT